MTLTTRRGFIRKGAVAAAALPAIASTLGACSETKADSAAAKPTPPAPPAPTPRQKADEMDAMHEAGVKAFPAKTDGLGQPARCEPRDGRRRQGLRSRPPEIVQWEVEPGKLVEAWAYNGVRCPARRSACAKATRSASTSPTSCRESTAVHFHGLELPNDQDGVPFITQPPIKPGETLHLRVHGAEGNAGSHMYHSHHNAAKQVARGCSARSSSSRRTRRRDRALRLRLHAWSSTTASHGYTLNGKGFPATQPLVAKQGEKVRIRYMNEGMMIHPMHLHGMHMTVIAKDG